MSAAHADQGHHHAVPADLALRPENISYPAGTGRVPGIALIALGVLLTAAALAMGVFHIAGGTFKQALAAYHVATMTVLAVSLGALFFTMVFHLTNAGWSATIRRQFENIAAFVPYAWLLIMPTLIIEIANHGILFAWLGDAAAGEHALAKKWAYFFGPTSEPGTHHAFPSFFVVRALLYGAIWTGLSVSLRRLSLRQDATGDKWLSARARFICSWGMILFALSTAFAAFDWLMSLDYGFFSTMWGVYYFAGAAYSSVAVAAIVLAMLRVRGKLEGAVTNEHFHDIGKLMFTFTVFWAYIAFSQYFLIWYSNIPEETAYYEFRYRPEWLWLGQLLIVGHFVAPFLILLFRKVKRTPQALIFMGLWAVMLEIADMFWVVRPIAAVGDHAMVTTPAAAYVIDVAAIVGIVAVFAGYLIQKVPKHNLVAVNDPWMAEALGHKNYV